MSLNYCEKNPVQGLRNNHCFHVAKRHPLKAGTRRTEAICCWCGTTTMDFEFEAHGPKRPKEQTT